MGDPTGLAGWAGRKILEKLYSEVQHALKFKTEWDSFKDQLDSLSSMLTEMDHDLRHNPQGYHLVARWLDNVLVSLNESKVLLESSQNVNVLMMSTFRKRIIAKREKIEKLVGDSVDKLLLIKTAAKTEQIMSEFSNFAKDGGQQSQAMAGRLATLRSFNNTERSRVGLDVDDSPFTPIAEPIFGRVKVLKELEDLLCSDHSNGNPTFIGLLGMGGAGKTCVAKALYNLPTVRSHFQHHVGWITLGRDYDVTNLKYEIERAYHDSRAKNHQIASIAELDVREKEKGKMFLVLDDVWTTEVLEFVVKKVTWIEGSKLLITTRLIKIFQTFKSVSQVDIGTLRKQEALELFTYHAFPCGKEGNISQELIEHVVAECKGLPLALKVIGKAMAGKTSVEWDDTLTKLRNQELVDDDHEKLINRLRISYDALKNIERYVGSKLQDCFLYFGAFKEDEEIHVRQLMKCWMGEGLLRSDRNTIEATYIVVGVLVASSLIEMPKKDYCRVHDVLRDLTFHISRMEKSNENLFQPASSRPPSLVLQNVRRISWRGIQFSPAEVKIKASNLQVLLLDDLGHKKYISQEFVNICVSSFHSLRILSLRETSINNLPSSLGRLKCLTALDLMFSTVKSIPSSLRKLTELKYLNMSNCKSLISFPFEALLRLKNLQMFSLNSIAWPCRNRIQWLSRHEAMKDEGFTPLQSLTKLIHLDLLFTKDMQMDKILRNNVDLRVLSLTGPLTDIEPLKGLVNMEELWLSKSMVHCLPDWICKFSSLKILIIRTKEPKTSYVPALESLSGLQRLELDGWESLTHLPSTFGRADGFPSLKELFMINFKSLEELPELENGAFPSLESLTIQGIKYPYKMPPSWGQHGRFAKLQFLSVDACVLPEIEEKTFEELKHLSVIDDTYQQAFKDDGSLDLRLEMKLDIHKYKTIEVPPSWMSHGRLNNLETLTFYFHMQKLPELSAAALPKLETLFLCGCEFPRNDQGALPRLQKLILYQLGEEILSSFWQFMENLPLLAELYLHGNGTTNFEKWGSICVPKMLCFSGFKRLPMNLGQKDSPFATLCYLRLSFSKYLEDLPDVDADSFPVLEAIDIVECMPLRAVPHSYSLLPRLQNVWITQCPQLMSWTHTEEGVAFAKSFNQANWFYDEEENEQASMHKNYRPHF